MPQRSRFHHIASEAKTIVGDELKIYPKDLNIIWGRDNRYWRFNEEGSAELIQVCWLEVKGAVSVKTRGKYKISLSVSLKDDSFGWNSCKPFVMARAGKGDYKYEAANLLCAAPPCGQKFYIPNDGDIVLNANEDDKLEFGLYEVWSGKWKGGLVIHHALIQQLNYEAPSDLPPLPHFDS